MVSPLDVLDLSGVEALPKPDFFENFIASHDVFILPIPFSRDGTHISSPSGGFPVDRLLSLASENSVIIGGCFTDSFLSKCSEKKITVYDLTNDLSFELLNSIATAEGAIAEAIKASPRNLHDSRCLVLGYGKCGHSLAERLRGLNARVTVCARNLVHRTKAFGQNLKAIDFPELEQNFSQFDFIFNTVPALVLTEDILENAKKNALIIDLASKPGGTDFEACARLGLRARLCLSLPGKYSPESSADIIYNSICHFLLSSF